MNTKNVKAWIAALRSTDKPQAEGYLCLVDGGVKSYCCLGLGSEMVPGMYTEDSDIINGSTTVRFGDRGAYRLAPAEFVEWLGLTPIPDRDEWDIWPDWPEGLLTQGSDTISTGGVDYLNQYDPVSYAAMNDAGFTFAQIADVIDYFGVRLPPL